MELPTKVYCDWNVMDRMHKAIMNDEEALLVYRSMVKWFHEHREEVVSPYTNAHLNDVDEMQNQGRVEAVSDALAFISFLTRNECMAQRQNDEGPFWHTRPPNDWLKEIQEDSLRSARSFEDLLASLPSLIGSLLRIQLQSTPHAIDFEKLRSIAPELLELFPTAIHEKTMLAAVSDLCATFLEGNMVTPRYLKLKRLFRRFVQLDTNMGNYQNVIEQMDGFYKSSILQKSFQEFHSEQMQRIRPDRIPTDYDNIIDLYMQLDFMGYRSDELGERNKYANLFNDALHCYYASYCDYLVTNDKNLRYKSKALYAQLGLTTTVCTPVEFVDRYMSQAA